MAKKAPGRAKPTSGARRQKTSGFQAALSGDRMTVALDFTGAPPLNLDVALVEELQRRLGEARAGMMPEVPALVTVDAPFSAVSSPRWVISPAGIPGGSLLNIRDPRYGWLHFLIPAEDGRKLLDFFTKLFSSLPSKKA